MAQNGPDLTFAEWVGYLFDNPPSYAWFDRLADYYNSVRRFRALLRRAEVVRLWPASPDARGWQARAAQELGVHPSTISRDVQALLDELNRTRRCPLCGRE